MRFLLAFLFICGLVSCKPGMNKILKSKDAAYKLKMAEAFYEQKKWGKAMTIYEDVLPYYKTTPQFQDIYYKYAYTAYNQKDYTNAENLFKTFLESFPNSPRSEEMEYMRAYTFYKQSPKAELDQTNTYKAISYFQTFINTHPQSVRVNEAMRLVDELRKKLEVKEYKSAMLYYNLGEFRAAGVSFSTLLDNYPESNSADQYKFMAIKSFYRFAELSIASKKAERFREVIEHANNFIERFPESKYRKEVEDYITSSNSEIQKFSNNEQVKTTT
ncbi:outer membrane protein assembly factor BamD [Mycovorax composti]|jgi:outer membrane assembly lipoprotein YfiO